MKYFFVLFLNLGLLINCSGQEADYCELYASSITEIKTPEYDLVDIKFNLNISESLKKSILNSNLFDNKEKKAFEHTFKRNKEKNKIFPCEKVRDLVINKKGKDKRSDFEKRTLIIYSKPISVNKRSAFLIMEQISMNSTRGVMGGATLLEIYAKVKHEWVLRDIMILEQY